MPQILVCEDDVRVSEPIWCMPFLVTDPCSHLLVKRFADFLGRLVERSRRNSFSFIDQLFEKIYQLVGLNILPFILYANNVTICEHYSQHWNYVLDKSTRIRLRIQIAKKFFRVYLNEKTKPIKTEIHLKFLRTRVKFIFPRDIFLKNLKWDKVLYKRKVERVILLEHFIGGDTFSDTSSSVHWW